MAAPESCPRNRETPCMMQRINLLACVYFLPLIARNKRRDVADEARRTFALALSDHLTLLKAYDGWRLARGCGSRAEREYIRDHFLSRQTLVMVEEMRRQFRGLLRDIGFIEGGGEFVAAAAICRSGLGRWVLDFLLFRWWWCRGCSCLGVIGA